MKVRLLEVVNESTRKPWAYKKLAQVLEWQNKRKYDYDSSGKKIELEKPIRLNTLVLFLKNQDGEIKERIFDFVGNKLILSKHKKNELTPELIKEIEKIGEEIFIDETSHSNVVVHSPGAKMYGNGSFVKNSPGVILKGDGGFVEEQPYANIEGNNVQIAPWLKPQFRKYVTASQLYNYEVCPHRVWRDANLLLEKEDPPNEFLELLWEKGIAYEFEIVKKLFESGNLVDLSEGTNQERFKNTLAAMQEGIPLIYQGVLIADELYAEPDLLQRMEDGSYIPIDIKAAMGVENNEAYEEGKLKESYALQLCLYSDALIRLGFSNKKEGIIYDIDGKQVLYNLNLQRNKRDKRTWWDVYQIKKDEVLELIQNKKRNEPALFSDCKLCHWLSSCTKWCEEQRDLSLIYKLGRAKKEIIVKDTGIKTIDDLAKANIEELVEQKKQLGSWFLKGIGEGTLIPLIRRAQYMVSGAKGVKILEPFTSPERKIELFFDIEADPTRDFVYLHGVTERRTDTGEVKHHSFVAKEHTEEAEKTAWKECIEYFRSLPRDFVVYHYAPYERVVYEKLQKKYPDVIDEEELNNLFNKKINNAEDDEENEEKIIPEPIKFETDCVDLYRLIDRHTDWPLKSYGLKPIGKSLGYNWRDPHASGAHSIAMFNRYIETKDPEILQQVIDYNEDDCKVMIVLVDYLNEKLKEFKTEKQRISLPVVS